MSYPVETNYARFLCKVIAWFRFDRDNALVYEASILLTDLLKQRPEYTCEIDSQVKEFLGLNQ